MRAAPSLSVMIAAAVIAIASPARGADLEKVEKQRAQSLLSQGNQLFGEGDYVNALEKFKGAYDHFKSPKILLNEATTLRVLGRNVEAAKTYESYLAAPDADPSKLANVKKAIADLELIVGRVEVKPSVAGASVSIDGTGIDAGSAARLDAGDHAIVVEKSGYTSAALNIHLAPGERRVVELALHKPGERASGDEANPGATQRTLGYVVGAAGVVAIGAAIGLTIAEVSKSRSAKDLCSQSAHFDDAWNCTTEGASDFDAASRLSTAATWTSIAGGLALAAGVTLALTAPRAKKEKAPPPVALRISPRAFAITLAF